MVNGLEDIPSIDVLLVNVVTVPRAIMLVMMYRRAERWVSGR